MNVKVSEIFGPVNASESETDMIVYSTDASRVPGEAKMVVHPVSSDQVQKFIQYARRGKMDIVPRGAGTGIAGGAVPKGSVVMDMSKMNRVLELGENFVKVEAGVILSELNRALKAKGVYVPIVPEANANRTIGGMVATNAAGLRIMEHGRMEDWADELAVVDGTGHYSKLAGEEARSFCGTEGIAGVVVSAKLRTLPVEAQKSMTILSFNTLTTMMEQVEELQKNEHVKMILYVDDLCSSFLELEPKMHLFIEYDNDEGNLKNAFEVDSAIGMIESLDGILHLNKRVVREDPMVPRQELAKFLNWLRKYNIPSYGHIDVGVIHPYFAENSDYERSELYKVVRSVQGSVGWEHGIGLLKKDFLSPERRKRLEVLKRNYDPDNLMNMGKVL